MPKFSTVPETGLQHLTSALIVSLATGHFWKTPMIRKNWIIYFSALLRVSGAGQLKLIPYLDSTGSKNPEVIPLESKKFPLSHKYSQNIIHRCCTPSWKQLTVERVWRDVYHVFCYSITKWTELIHSVIHFVNDLWIFRIQKAIIFMGFLNL